MPNPSVPNKSLGAAIRRARALKAEGKKAHEIVAILIEEGFDKFKRGNVAQDWTPGLLQQMGV